MEVRKCLFCNSEITNPRFCNSSCAAKYNNSKRKERTEESKKKVSNKLKFFYQSTAGIILKTEQVKKGVETRKRNGNVAKQEKEMECTYCKEKFVSKKSKSDHWPRLCSDKCLHKMKTYNAKGIKRQEYNGQMFDSGYEVKVAKWLDQNNVKWERGMVIYWKDKNEKQHRYFPDFYLPSYNVYLDPKNKFCIEQQKEKIEIIEKQINLIYGTPEQIINKLTPYSLTE